jgi:phage-related minor tail protein
MTGKKNFTDFANAVIADIMRIAIRQAIVQPIAQGLMGAFGLSAPVAAMAGGGPVFGGSSYLVGERGPELFVPSSSGSIVPGGRGGSVTVNVQNNTGQPIEKKNVRASFDAQGMVIDMVLDGITRNVHGIRNALGGA